MRRFMSDLETTNDIKDCRVWLAGIAEIPEDHTTSPAVVKFNNLEGLMNYIEEQKEKVEIYFHNLKFDGQFILDYLLRSGFEYDNELSKANTFRTLITSDNVFYSIEVCYWAKKEKNGKDEFGKQKYKTKRITAKFLDSYKKLPLSVEDIAKSFNFEIQKGTIDYNKKRGIDYQPTFQEIAYLETDIIIVARALSLFFAEGMDRMTISSDALKTFKQQLEAKENETGITYRWLFPRLDKELDDFIRRAYKGGFVAVNEKYKGKEIGKGVAFDVNSLYPAVMKFAPLPFGKPVRFEGYYFESENEFLHKTHDLFIQEFVCSYKLKENRPAICQKEHAFLTSLYSEEGYYENLCMTSIDLNIFFECYEVKDFTPLGGLAFASRTGMFNDYVDHFSAMKVQAKKEKNHGRYILSKLMLNSLSGKFASRVESFIRIPEFGKNEVVKYKTIKTKDKDPNYTAISAFITAYGRQLLVNAIIENYERWAYNDTDSIHLIGWEMPEGMWIDNEALGAWKCEGFFNRAIFLKQKAYIEEYVYKVDSFDDETGEVNMTLINDYKELKNTDEENLDSQIEVKVSGAPREIREQINFENFKPGSVFQGKKEMKTVKGGRVIIETDFTLK